MSALPALEQGRAKKLVKQRMKNKKRTKTEEEEEEEEDAKEEEPVAKKPRAATPGTKPLLSLPNKTVTQKRKSKDDMRFNGQNIDAAGPLGTLFKQRETKEKEAGVVAHQNSANVKVQMTNEFRKEALDRITLKKAAANKKNKDSEEAKKTAAEQKKNTDSEEDKPQEEVLHGLTKYRRAEEFKNR